MITATEERPMAAKKGRPPNPAGEGAQVRVDSDIVSMGRYLVAQRCVDEKTITELFSKILRPEIEKLFAAAGRKLMGEIKPKGKG